MKKTLTIDEVSAEYGIPVNTLRYWRQLGSGPRSSRIGRRVFYLRSEVEEWFESAFGAADAT